MEDIFEHFPAEVANALRDIYLTTEEASDRFNYWKGRIKKLGSNSYRNFLIDFIRFSDHEKFRNIVNLYTDGFSIALYNSRIEIIEETEGLSPSDIELELTRKWYKRRQDELELIIRQIIKDYPELPIPRIYINDDIFKFDGIYIPFKESDLGLLLKGLKNFQIIDSKTPEQNFIDSFNPTKQIFFPQFNILYGDRFFAFLKSQIEQKYFDSDLMSRLFEMRYFMSKNKIITWRVFQKKRSDLRNGSLNPKFIEKEFNDYILDLKKNCP